ncbi:unnamed protein product [Effrenium voratum]|nr:unnamed protein product [Effrenium voratum]
MAVIGGRFGEEPAAEDSESEVVNVGRGAGARPAGPAQAAKMRRRPAAALPAAPAELAPPIGERLTSSKPTLRQFAARLASGRTREVLLALQSCNLFRFDAPAAVARPGPQRGLSADLHGEPCYILDTFMLRGAVMADIGLVRAQRDGSRFTLGKLQTDALSNVRFYFHIVQANAQRLLLEVAGTGQDTRPLEVAAACLQGQADATSPFAAAPRQAQAVRHIRPQAASAHAEEWGHRVAVWGNKRSQEPLWVWDLPYPMALDRRPWRCQTCAREGAARGVRQYFPVTAADVRLAVPGAMRHKAFGPRSRRFSSQVLPKQ